MEMEMDGKTRAFIALAKRKFASGDYDDIYEAAYDVMYEDWKLPENEGKSYGEMVHRAQATYGDLAALLQLLGAFNYQVCNGGIVQWYDNGYASMESHGWGSNKSDHDLFDMLRDLFDESDLVGIKHGSDFSQTLTQVADLFQDLEDIETCYTCEGKRWVECPTCDGSGIVKYDDDDEDEEETCEECDGNGQLPCDGCNPEGLMDENQNPDFSCLGEYLLNRVDTGYYKYNEEWMKSLDGYLTGLAGQIGIRAKARSMGLSEARIREGSDSADKIIDMLDASGLYYGFWNLPGRRVLTVSDENPKGNCWGKLVISAATWRGVYDKLTTKDLSPEAMSALKMHESY